MRLSLCTQNPNAHCSRAHVFLLFAAFGESKKWTPGLEEVLREIALTGASQFTWDQLKGVIASKIEQVTAEYYAEQKDLNEPYDEMLKRCLALLHEFPNPPFTVQRFAACSRPTLRATRCAAFAVCRLCAVPPAKSDQQPRFHP